MPPAKRKPVNRRSLKINILQRAIRKREADRFSVFVTKFPVFKCKDRWIHLFHGVQSQTDNLEEWKPPYAKHHFSYPSILCKPFWPMEHWEVLRTDWTITDSAHKGIWSLEIKYKHSPFCPQNVSVFHNGFKLEMTIQFLLIMCVWNIAWAWHNSRIRFHVTSHAWKAKR